MSMRFPRLAAGILAAVMLASLAGCGGGGGGSQGTGTPGGDGGPGGPRSLLIVGEYTHSLDEFHQPCYWISPDLAPVDLPLPEGMSGGMAWAVAAKGDTVVIVGGAYSPTRSVPTVWTRTPDGDFTVATAPLPGEAGSGVLEAVVIDGGTIRAAGEAWIGGSRRAAYWSDVTATPVMLPFPASGVDSDAGTLAIDGADVYVGGGYVVKGASAYQPYAWKNGAALSPVLAVPSGSSGGMVNSIAVTPAHEVILAGLCFEAGACAWKPGVAQPTILPGTTYGGVVALAPVGDDLVFIGDGDLQGNALYWKASAAEATPMAKPGGAVTWDFSSPSGVVDSNGTLVVVGTWADPWDGWFPCLWNGLDAPLTTLPLPEGVKAGMGHGITAL